MEREWGSITVLSLPPEDTQATLQIRETKKKDNSWNKENQKLTKSTTQLIIKVKLTNSKQQVSIKHKKAHVSGGGGEQL